MARGFNSWMMVEDDKLKAIGEIVQMLHNARYHSLQFAHAFVGHTKTQFELKESIQLYLTF